MTIADYASYDRSLEALRPFGPDLKNGLSNHVPMVAEALCALGEADASQRWVTGHLDTISPRGAAPFKLDPANWQNDLGRFELFGDWQRYFETEITALGWEKALDKWALRMAPGLFASATHGIIRAGHAARGLAAAETALRTAELADGLAVWAATYQPLPTDLGGAPRYGSVAEAFEHLPRVPKSQRNNEGLITDALSPLADMPEFPGVISWIDVESDPESCAHQLAVRQAHTFLDHVTTPLLAIVFTHAITSVHAILNLAPHISRHTLTQLLAYGWQAGAALYAAYTDDVAPNSGKPAPESETDMVATAVAHGDDHAIKLTEACVAFHHRTGDSIFLSVPAHARAMLPAD